MKISTKGRYALRLLIDLAEHRDEGFISLKEIAARQEISKKYLEQIIPLFNKTDILNTTRGSQGGYMLVRSPEEISIGEILRLTEGSLSPVSCVDSPESCNRSADCATLPVWQGLSRVIDEYLDSITLQDLLDQQREHAAYDYMI